MKTTNEILKETLDEKGFSGYLPSQMSNSDWHMITNNAMEAYAKETLPTDEEVTKWWDENINDDSAGSAVYKFRLWLKERLNR